MNAPSGHAFGICEWRAMPLAVGAMTQRRLSFSGPKARVQYALLMGLFRLAVTRGLYGRFARGLGRIFGPGTAVWLHEGGAPPYRIALDDGYWTRFPLYLGPYEPEVARVLRAAAHATPLFCDLGANKGYWTTRAAPLFDQVIAVEAAQSTFRDLHDNAGGLDNVTLHRAAIHARSGEVMRFINTHLSHASARLEVDAPAQPRDRLEQVETLAIDDVVPAGTPALLKLDVEGAEIAAIDGAARALADGAVLIYEDHGNDPDCTVSLHLLTDPAMRLFAIEDTLVPMPDIATLRARKADPYKGYNFLAARAGSPLLDRISQGFATVAPSG
jgi:FkbM family methyltransferase